MNYSEILAQLKTASAFDLYRLRAAIERALDEPAWMVAVQARLHVGHTVEYFDPQTNASHVGQVLELRHKQAVVLDKATGQRWRISYAGARGWGATEWPSVIAWALLVAITRSAAAALFASTTRR